MLHHVLNLLHGGGPVHLLALQRHVLGNALNLHGGQPVGLLHGVVGPGDGHDDFGDIKGDFRTVALDNLHRWLLLFFSLCPAPQGAPFSYSTILPHILGLRKGKIPKYREE